MLKADELLLDAVFEDLKVLFLQILDQAVAVEHGAVEHHLFNVGVQNVALALFCAAAAAAGASHPASAPGPGPR